MASRRLKGGRPLRKLGSSAKNLPPASRPAPTHSTMSSEVPFAGFGATTSSSDFCKAFESMSFHSLPKSAGSREAAIPELLEHILLFAIPVNGRRFWLLRIERVSRAFQDCIEGSPALKRRLLLCSPAEKKADVKQSAGAYGRSRYEARDEIYDEPEKLWSWATGNSSSDPTGNHYLTVDFDHWDELSTILQYKESSLRRTYFNEDTYCVTQVIVFASREVRRINTQKENCTVGELFDFISAQI